MLKISACTIVKNEERNISRWIEAVRLYADEIIVVDTGSIDSTKVIAENLGATVHEFAWCDDFSMAKNYAIEKCTGDWITFLDADEFFTESSRKLLRNIILRYDRVDYVAGFIIIRTNIDEKNNNEVLSMNWNLRVFRNDEYLRYAGRIHESLQDYKNVGKKREFPLVYELNIIHTGYSADRIKSKIQRNLNLLLTDIKECGGELPRHYGYLQDCYYSLGEYDKALHYGRLALKYRHESGIIGQTNSIVCRLLNTIRMSGLGDYGYELKQAITLFPEFAEVRFFYGQYLLSNLDGVEAKRQLKIALQLYDKAISKLQETHSITFPAMKNISKDYLKIIKKYYHYYESIKKEKYKQAADIAGKFLADTYRRYPQDLLRTYLHKENDSGEKNVMSKSTLVTSIIILNMNLMTYTKQLIESIRKYTNREDYEIIVVDNGSNDGSVEWLQEQKDVRLIVNRENVGFPKGCNQGLRIAQGQEMMLLNNDTVVTHNWLTNLRNALYSAPNIGAVGPVSNSCSNMQEIDVPYVNINTAEAMEEMQCFAQKYNVSDPRKWYKWQKLIGYCLLFKEEVFAQIGEMDEAYTPGNYEDDDYCIRMRKAGYELLLCYDTFIHHFGSTTFRSIEDDQEKMERYNGLKAEKEKYFCKKWGVDSQTYTRFRTFVRDLVFANEGLRIMEYGVDGTMDLYILGYLCPHSEITGTTDNENDLLLGGSYPLIYLSNCMHFINVLDGEYDLIIIPYNFEKMSEDKDFTEKLESHLCIGGWLIAVINGEIIKAQRE